MGLRQIVVIGGGPGGLLAARLLRRRWRCPVTVFERQPPGSTYGFGVALHDHAMSRLEAVDREAWQALLRLGYPLRRWIMQRDGEQVGIDNDGGLGIGRATALGQLTELAERAGVDVQTGHEVAVDEVGSADLVIAADGVGSATRERLAPALGVHVDPGPIPFVWCGAAVDPGGMLLATAETDDGIFTAHVMPFAPGRATFQVDTEPAALERAGLATASAATPAQESDRATLEYLESAFADVLNGGPLEGNRSRWSIFSTVACDRWWHARTVLVGDAAHTAHYTVGSGTRMAMEDAIALADALDGGGSLEESFIAYEQARRPAVERLQSRARRSQRWWASLRSRFRLPLATLLLSYYTRTGSVSLGDLTRSNRLLLEGCLRLYDPRADPLDVGGGILASPFPLNGRMLAGRVLGIGHAGASDPKVAYLPAAGVEAWSPASESFCRHAEATRREGAEVLCLTGPPARDAVLDRLDVAEQVRLATRTPVAVEAPPGHRDDLAIGLLTQRIDLAALTPDESR